LLAQKLESIAVWFSQKEKFEAGLRRLPVEIGLLGFSFFAVTRRNFHYGPDPTNSWLLS
jgi:hypothetical protein